MAKKFIITDDVFIMADVDYHKDMIPSKQPITSFKVLGGGRWEIDFVSKVLYLWGASLDFGYAEPEKIKKAILSENTWISPSLEGWPIKHSPYVSDVLPDKSTFKDLMLVPTH